MSDYRFGCDDYKLNIYPKEAFDGCGGFDIDKVERVEIDLVDFVRERECEMLPPTNGQTCIVRHNSTGFEMQFGYWRCSVCGCNNFEGAKFCMECGAKVVKR